MRPASALIALTLAATLLSTAPLRAQEASELIRKCAELASSSADNQRPAGVIGVSRDALDAAAAVPACEAAFAAAPEDAGTAFNLGRALSAKGEEADLPRMAQLYKQAADKGYVVGQINYGQANELGLGVPVDYPTAVTYYRQAAEAGHPVGQYNFALMLDAGRGIAQDYAAAAHWYKRAVAQGDSTAMLNLGLLYDAGHGVPQDYAKARALYEQSAELGEPGALTNLGWLIDRGLGGFAKDPVKANEYYRQAADAGDPQGMNNLGESLLIGEGIGRDEAAGLALIQQAYDEGNDMAAHNFATFYASGQHVAADPGKAASFYLEALIRNSDDAQIDLFDKAGADLPPDVLAAIYAEMAKRGMTVTPEAGKLSVAAITALKATVQP